MRVKSASDPTNGPVKDPARGRKKLGDFCRCNLRRDVFTPVDGDVDFYAPYEGHSLRSLFCEPSLLESDSLD